MEVFRADLHNFPLRAYLDSTREAIGAEALAAMLAPYGVTEADLRDSTAWVSLEFVEAFLRDMIANCEDPDHFVRATRLSMTPKYIGPAAPLVTALGTPLFAYGQLGKSAAVFNRTGAWSLDHGEPGRARLSFRHHADAPRERSDLICRCRQIQMAMIPPLFNRPAGVVEHPSCMLRGDDACVYDVVWTEPPRRMDSLVGLGAGGAIGAALAWAGISSAWIALLVVVVFGLAGWALGRLGVMRSELAARVQELTDHNDALAKISHAHEQRFAELSEAKAEVEKKVEQRTSELREATQRLSETLQEIQALDRAKTDFFNNVSHELRSPLTLILAPLEDLAAGRSPPGGERSAFESMRRNAARLLHLINQLLDLAKIDAGQMEIAPAPTDLVALVRSTLTGFEAAAQKKGIQLGLRAPAVMSPVVLDASWIESALTNLVANALRFTSSGGGVRVAVEDRGADVVVSVNDDGPGIAPEDQNKVFARFAQGDSSKRVVGGTGIGLALVREATRLHGGDVKLVSEFGKGSTFTITLPRRPDMPTTDSPSGRPASLRPARAPVVQEIQETRASERPGPAPNAPLALVVEDNPELREFMADVLAVRYRVRTAADGAEGIALAMQLKPDVVVSDVAMPEKDGYELCRALRAGQETQATPVLLVTARTEVASVLEGFEAGANDYVLKPFHGRELLARVDVHVRLRRMVQELALRERHAMLGVLAASVAHQVRNPLTTLVSGLPAMRGRLRDKVDPSTRDLMDVMIDCASRIERLTLDLMDLSRVDREIGGTYRPCDGLRASLRLIRARVEGEVTVDEQIEDSAAIEGRAGDMNHVFLNLLDNAVRAVGSGGCIRVDAWNEGAFYVVRVGDSGPGVDAETAQRIFEPFFTTRPAGEGTGLGLAIARQVVQQNGGSIELGRSDLGGAAFTVRIPMSSRSSAQPPVQVGMN